MSVNINNLISTLDKLISSATAPIDILTYSKTLEQLKLGAVFTVSSYSNLPVVDLVEPYTLYLVETENLIYIPNKTYNTWIPLLATNIGQTWTWGANTCGMLGSGFTTSRSSPASIIGGITDWKVVDAACEYTVGLRSDGTLWSWGRNNFGQLGDNTVVNSSSPVSVVGGINDWIDLTAGRAFNIALRRDGTIWTWGCGYRGALGTNSFSICRSSPVSVVGGFTNWCKIGAGILHAAAVRSDGSLWTWGGNTIGQLGDNSTTCKASPVSVATVFSNWCDVSVGYTHTLGLATNGDIWAWGDNTCGELGEGSVVNRSSPVSVVGGFTDWCQISAGDSLSAAVRSNGSIWTWGCATRGGLGDNTSTIDRSSPVSVVGGFTDWCYVNVGECAVAALRTNGELWAWGSNLCGTLGDNTLVSQSSPVSVVGGFANWYRVNVGSSHIAAIRCLDF